MVHHEDVDSSGLVGWASRLLLQFSKWKFLWILSGFFVMEVLWNLFRTVGRRRSKEGLPGR